MTVEQMNVVIAEYAGLRFHSNGTVSQYPTIMKLDMGVTTANELTFHTDWNAVHFVWQKLRGELVLFRKDALITAQKRLLSTIEDAILDTDITTAHRLIVEAIQLIKK